MKSKVYSTKGEELRTIELDEKIFGLPINEDVIWYAINNELANKRLGTAHTKDRSEVHGSNAKPYKQKGTGRARRGDKKSPLLVGGGVIFGPRHRDFSYSMPKKAKRLAIKTILSLKAQSEMLKLIEDFSVESGKTKDLAAIIKNFSLTERTVLVLNGNADQSRKIRQAGANIPYLTILSYHILRAHDLFYARKLIMFEGAAQRLSEFYDEVEARQ
ncbi:MAG: 50S ribosomal protein L4 [Spirochaetaceae bacterium]|jgi:large subunit ribosomal protein L4|nr:50S ribosomal protein L4 [Spirochaetaceae bacterium]